MSENVTIFLIRHPDKTLDLESASLTKQGAIDAFLDHPLRRKLFRAPRDFVWTEHVIEGFRVVELEQVNESI